MKLIFIIFYNTTYIAQNETWSQIIKNIIMKLRSENLLYTCTFVKLCYWFRLVNTSKLESSIMIYEIIINLFANVSRHKYSFSVICSIPMRYYKEILISVIWPMIIIIYIKITYMYHHGLLSRLIPMVEL